jgi:hypothetical protein
LRPAILRAEYGRLGNQLFQYSALASLQPRVLLLQGFGSLFEAFANVRARQISWPSGRSLKRFDRRVGLSPTLRRIVSTVDQDRDTGSIVVSGRGPFLYCQRATFFQSPEYLDAGLELEFREEVTAVGEEFLERVGLTGRPFIFVHVRGGDYRSWPSKEAPAFVPSEWLIRSAETVLDRHPGTSCVVLGDDPEELERLRLALGAHVSDLPEASDLWLMSASTAGVLSASSFSLWGSARAFYRAGAPGPFIAPNYWINHRTGEWGASNIRHFEHLTFCDVLA